MKKTFTIPTLFSNKTSRNLKLLVVFGFMLLSGISSYAQCGSLDSVGDGVFDLCDLDDDNDGILDSDECFVNRLLQRVSSSIATPLVYSLGQTSSTVTLNVTTDTGLFGYAIANRFNINETNTG